MAAPRKKKPYWRQPSPRDQLTAELAAIAGWVNNGLDGVSDPKKALEKIKKHLIEAQDVLPMLPNPSWDGKERE